jgi:serpin B
MKQRNLGILALVSLIVLGITIAGCTSAPGTTGTHPAQSPSQSSQTTPPPTGNATTATSSKASVTAANNRFDRDLYMKLANDPQYAGNNIFFSPFSISSALAITYEGARGTTADEIRSVFHFPAERATLREGFSRINAGINTGDANYALNTANALWAENTYAFLPDYISTAWRWYSANVTNLDFIGHLEASRRTINSWVAGKTAGKIQELLPAGSINSETRLVITNAVYFKGNWRTQFDANETQDADFRVSPQKTVKVKMMQRTGGDAVYGYTETADLQVLSMPYAHGSGSGLSMIVLLPGNDSLAAAEAALDPQNLSALEQRAYSQRVMVYFPKFRVETEYSLRGTLASMGMPTAFTNAADFSGMDGARDLYVSSVIHKAFVNVDEKGTVAAAATAVGMSRITSLIKKPVPVPVFRADHPFLFLIQDNNTGAILFAGRVTNPGGTQ